MVKTILVYVTKKEVVTGTSYVTCTGKQPPLGEFHQLHRAGKTEKVMPEEDESALKLAKELAVEKGLRVQVINVTSLKGRVSARLKGVKTTPTIILGKNRLSGVPEKGELENLLRNKAHALPPNGHKNPQR